MRQRTKMLFVYTSVIYLIVDVCGTERQATGSVSSAGGGRPMSVCMWSVGYIYSRYTSCDPSLFEIMLIFVCLSFLFGLRAFIGLTLSLVFLVTNVSLRSVRSGTSIIEAFSVVYLYDKLLSNPSTTHGTLQLSVGY